MRIAKQLLFSLLLLIFFFPTQSSFAQKDTVKVETYRMASVDTIVGTFQDTNFLARKNLFKKRERTVGYTSIGLYAAALVTLNQAWYADYPRSPFHFFNDDAEWLQMDKAGHAWSAYQISRSSFQVWKWAGVSDKKATLYAGLSGPGFLTVIEILDGFSSQWGFSPGDMSANVFGGGLFVGQQLLWGEQRINYKFSFHRKNYGSPMLNARADDQFGSSLAERTLKDYNGQTYWLGFNIRSFLKKSGWPAWLNLDIGYGAEGMFGAMNNVGTNKDGSVFDRSDIPRVRQWYFAPDVDFTKIKTNSKLLHTVFFILNGFKFPLPALQFSHNKFTVQGMVF
jgi:hypothetical protein